MRRESKRFVTLDPEEEQPNTIESIKKEVLDEYKQCFESAREEVGPFEKKDKNQAPEKRKDYQRKLFNAFIEWTKQIPQYKSVEGFSTAFSEMLEKRETIIEKNLEKLAEHLSQNKLYQHNFVQFRVAGFENNKLKIKNKLSKSTTIYTREKDLEKIAENKDSDFIPVFGEKGYSRMIEAKNVILLSKNKNVKIPEFENDPLGYKAMMCLLGQADYVMMARVKKNERQREKDTDYVSGIRSTLPHDSIGLMIITQKEKLLKTIYEVYDTLDSKGKYNQGNIDVTNFEEITGPIKGNSGNLKYNSALIENVISTWWSFNKETHNQIITRLEKEANKTNLNYKSIVSDEDRHALLRFLKMYITLGGYKTEIILNTHETSMTYFGSLGHHASYYEWRTKDRIKKHKQNNTDLIKSQLDEIFSKAYFHH